MVRFDEVQGKDVEKIKGGAYYRCFGNVELAHLLSRVQSLIIGYGTALEKLVLAETAQLHIPDLDEFLSEQIMDQGVRVASKSAIRRAKTVGGKGIEPDFMVFRRDGRTQNCYVIELKDGHEFDTKSSAKESANLADFIRQNRGSRNEGPLRWFKKCHGCIVGFNAETREEIQAGFKMKIALEQAMTGRQFCELVEIDYDGLCEARAADRGRNFDSFMDDLVAITEVREALRERLSEA